MSLRSISKLVLQEARMLESLVTPSSNSAQSINDWRDSAAKFALFVFGIVLWHKASAIAAGSLLILMWILCGGLLQLRSIIKEPLSVALLSFCGVLLLGLLWSDYPNSGRFRWDKYLGLLIFIPYLSLLNKDRLFWALGGLVIGCLMTLLLGLYYWFYLGVPGIPPLKMAYLHFSLGLGVGVLLAQYGINVSKSRRMKILIFVFCIFLIFIQFQLPGRGPLLATVVAVNFAFFLLIYNGNRRTFSIMVMTNVIIVCFFLTSGTILERVSSMNRNIVLSMSENQIDPTANQTSVGERIAYLKMGIYAIEQKPWFGYGTGMARKAFEENAERYEKGRYKDVLNYSPLHSFHYHNDLIEMGVFLGLLGISAYLFLLWGWFKSLQMRGLTILGATLVCFIFMSGLTDVILIYGQIPSLLLVITAIAIVWQREYGNLTRETERLRESP